MNYDMKPIVDVMDSVIKKLNKIMEKKIEINYYILNGISGTFNTIYITAKSDMVISDVFDLIRRKHKKDKNIIELKLLDIEKLKSKL